MDSPWLMQGDCLERMQEIPDGSVDLVCCDLPYGTTQNKWDIIIPLNKLWEQYKRVIKKSGCLVFTSCQPFTSQLVLSNKEWFRFDDVWDKVRGIGYMDAKRRPLRRHESLVIFAPTGKFTYNPQMRTGKMREKKGYTGSTNYGDITLGKSNINDQYYPTSIVVFSNSDQRKKVHPTQKPVGLFTHLIETYSNPGDTVLDNAMGSGTTIISAIDTGRKSIGIEKEEPIFKVATQRIQDHIQASGSLLRGLS